MPIRLPRILDRFIDAFGKLHVVDEDGEETVLTLPAGMEIQDGKLGINPQNGGSTFGVNVDYQGGSAEIRWNYSDDAANNRSYVWVGLYAHTSGFTTTGNAWFNIRVGGDGYTGGYVTIKSAWVLIAARDAWIGHDAAGAASVEVGVVNGEVQGTSFNNAWGTQWQGLSNYTVLPYAPYNLSIRSGSVATTSFGVDYYRNSYDAVDQDEFQWALDAGFTQVVWTDTKSAGYSNPAGATPPVQLTPGTLHYVRGRSHTAAGWGPYSGTVSQTTLPAVPPGLVVATSPSGTSATLTFSPPGGVTGVTKYVWERRATNTTAPVATGESAAIVTTVEGLTPGNSYDWRASAYIGTYQSPWTTWLTLVQAKPNIDPGQYFDGATPDVADLNYQWGTDGSGAPNASISTALASGVAGWVALMNSGAAVLYRVTAGILGSAYAARVQITVDATDHGNSFGQASASPYWTDVTPGGTYIGSIHVRPSKSQMLTVAVDWLTAAGAHISYTLGGNSVVAGGTWTRLAGGGIAPAGAVKAAVRVMDVNGGAGWSTWKGGDTLDLDGAMISLSQQFPYFDGSTTDTAEYLYDWVDPTKPNASTSKRTPTAQAGSGTFGASPGGLSARAILDPNCIPPAPPRPPTIPNECITEAGIWRRTWADIPAVQVSDWLDVVPTFDIVTLSLAASQVRIRIYPNPSGGAASQVDPNSWISEQIVSYLPKDTVLTIDGVHQRVWASVSGADAISADHLLYGSGGKPPTWPVLSCGIAYSLSVDLPVEILQGDSRFYTYLTTRY